MKASDWNALQESAPPAAPAPAPLSPTRRNVEAFVGGAADIADMGLIGVPGFVMANIGDILNRAQGLSDVATGRRTRREVGEKSQALYETMAPKFFRPLLERAGILSPNSPETAVQKVESWFAQELERSAESAEERSGGKILKEDYLSLANTLMAGLGTRGAQVSAEFGAKKLAERREARKQREFAADVEEAAMTAEASTPPPPSPPPPSPPRRPDFRAKTAAEMAAQEAAEARAAAQKRADVEAAFAESPEYADLLRAEAEGTAATREMRRAESERLRGEAFPERTRPAEGTEAGERAQTITPNEFGDLIPRQPTALESGLQKINRGRSFDLTAEELAAVNKSKSSWNRPDLAKQFSDFQQARAAEAQAQMRQGATREARQSAARRVLRNQPEAPPAPPSRKTDIALAAGGMRSQMGFADPKLLGAIAAIGGGAAIGSFFSSDENKFAGMGIGAAGAAAILFGLAKLREHPSSGIAEIVQDGAKMAEYVIGNVSSELRDLSQPVLRALTRHEWGKLKGVQDDITRVAPLVKMLSEAPKALQAGINAAVLTGRAADVAREFAKARQPGMLKAWQDSIKVLNELGNELVKYGELRQLRPDYFPRLVVDYEGLMKYLGTEARSALEQKILEANTKSIQRTGAPLDSIEMSELINKYLESGMRSGGGGKPGFLKNRTIDEVTAEMSRFYAPASESLPIYIEAARARIERAKFFGKHAVRDPETRKLNVEASVGNMLAEDLATGKISPEQAEGIRRLIGTRFGAGEGNPSRLLQGLRNAGYIALMGNVVSAIQNLADAGSIAAVHGMLPTIKGLAASITRRPERITSADMGLARNMAEEFVHGTRKPVTLMGRRISLAKATDTVFKYSGFSALDRGMKEVKANAVVADYSRKAKTERGVAEIQRRYGDYFRTDMPQLLSDLRAGKKSPLVLELAFRELSDTQPTTRIEVPEAYLANPNLRPLYMLKTFSIKQLNLLRDRGIKEIRRGNPVEGTKFLLRYGIALGIAGATIEQITNAILGRDSELEASDIPENALKAFGWSQYATDQVREGNVGKALVGIVAPPFGVFADMFATEPQVDEEGKPIEDTSQWRGARYIPWVGRIYYDREMGGAEKYNRREELKRQREEGEN